MPPIPIHKNAPITAAKPDGVTPSTASSSNPANPLPTRTTPASVPAATTAPSSDPPPPQPGGRPPAPTGPTYSGVYTPAPPQPGPTPTATVITTETRPDGSPPQFAHPPPLESLLAGRSTTTATGQTLSKPGPTFLNYGPVASPLQSVDPVPSMQVTTDQERSLEHPPGYAQAPDNAPYTTGGGIGGQPGRAGAEGNQDEGVGATAWGMLSKAGEALKSGEEAVWRAVKGR
ncbi:hypothetical protein J1614_000136 [Plenodomus biglobosus]|nr:hypothetical protein J1614_000136 [Plenodomus biglobosus]